MTDKKMIGDARSALLGGLVEHKFPPVNFRLQLDPLEIKLIKAGQCSLLIRDLNNTQRNMIKGDIIYGTESFGFLEDRTLIYRAEATEAQAVEIRHNGRWRPPFSLPSNQCRFKFEVRNLTKKPLNAISLLEFQETGHNTEKAFFENFGNRFDIRRRAAGEAPVVMIWFKRLGAKVWNNSGKASLMGSVSASR